jgi:GTP-binding protein LepA
MSNNTIRNFCIIAHIDHGKSTLADRLLEKTKTITQQQMQNQVLDDMDLERERGITIKSHAIRMNYIHKSETYSLNMIDTPGHVDFTYEVSRSLAACEGALLIVDASQGIEAQTMSNLYLAMDAELTIIPIINKIDLPGAEPDRIADLVGDLLGYPPEDIPRISAKNGINIEDVLTKIIEEVPAPAGDEKAPLSALIFDSVYDSYRGVIAYVRVFDGTLDTSGEIVMMQTNADYQVSEAGTFSLVREPRSSLKAGEVGYLQANIKTLSDIKIGDTITMKNNPCAKPLAGYKEIQPMIFSGLYPVEADDYKNLREALEKLTLNDPALVWEPETSEALGFGFRCGFLGLLHMEIIQERLDREFNANIITTMPAVEYHVQMKDGSTLVVENPSRLPDLGEYEKIEEPFIKAQIYTPKDYVGSIMKLCEEKRGNFLNMDYIDELKVNLQYELPMGEVMFDFYDRLKSISQGYAGFDYETIGYRKSDLVRLDMLLNGEPVDAFSVIIHREKAYYHGQAIAVKLKDLIPRQQFDVAVQAAVGQRVIARTTIKAVRKNVTAKCYGGDISRKRKLLEKQKEGKKRMKAIGNVEVPQEAFLAVLRLSD